MMKINPCIVTEKIHGANFSIYLLKEPDKIIIRYASRQKFLNTNDTFFN